MLFRVTFDFLFSIVIIQCTVVVVTKYRPIDMKSVFAINLILECGPMPNVMVALPNIGGALCSMPQSLADAQY